MENVPVEHRPIRAVTDLIRQATHDIETLEGQRSLEGRVDEVRARLETLPQTCRDHLSQVSGDLRQTADWQLKKVEGLEIRRVAALEKLAVLANYVQEAQAPVAARPPFDPFMSLQEHIGIVGKLVDATRIAEMQYGYQEGIDPNVERMAVVVGQYASAASCVFILQRQLDEGDVSLDQEKVIRTFFSAQEIYHEQMDKHRQLDFENANWSEKVKQLAPQFAKARAILGEWGYTKAPPLELPTPFEPEDPPSWNDRSLWTDSNAAVMGALDRDDDDIMPPPIASTSRTPSSYMPPEKYRVAGFDYSTWEYAD